MIVPLTAVGLRLGRITQSDELVLCEAIRFDEGYPAVDTVLRRASISGRVEINGKIENHLADILDDNCDIIARVALDAKSYRAIKTRWMRCKVSTR